MSSVPVRQAGPLLSAVLAYCAEHPYSGEDLAPGSLTMQRHLVGTERVVSVLGEAPHVVHITVELLDAADPGLVSFDRGLLRLNVVPELLYEPLYVSWRADSIVFRRVCTRCHGLRKVPDWSQGLDPIYLEPQGKPCPECLGWPQ